MKNLIKTLLISTIITGAAFVSAGAECFAQTLSVEKFKSIVAAQAKKDLQKYNLDDCEVTVGHMPVQSFTLPDGKVTVEIVSNGYQSLTAKEFKKVNIKVNGAYARTYYVPLETKAFKYVAVAKEMIPRDKVIPLQAVEFKKMDVIGNLDNTVSLEDITKELVATKAFYPGNMITKRYTIAKPDVVKNAMVTVNFRTSSAINIAVEGIALSQGNKGDMIQVKNKRFNKIYTGEVTGVNQVLVQI